MLTRQYDFTHTRNTQSGVALISILLVFAIVVVLVSDQIRQTRYSIKTTEFTVRHSQAWQYALADEAYAIESLYKDTEENKAGTDFLGDVWSMDQREFKPDDGAIQLSIEDLQGRFNINSLVSKDGKANQAQVTQFKNMLSHLNLSPEIAELTADWLDENNDSLGPDAENRFYENQSPPYLTAGVRIADTSELFALAGVKNEDIRALLPYIAALPKQTPININTAKEPVIASLSPYLRPYDVIASRNTRETGFKTTSEFMLDSSSAGVNISGNIDVRSSFFLATTKASFGSYTVTLASTLERNANSGKIRVLGRTLLSPLFSSNHVNEG